MKKIDKRIAYYLVVDVETAGGFDNPMVYDVGFAITDRRGKIYEERSFVISEVYENKKLMRGAYYANKMPIYDRDIISGKRTVVTFMEMREEFLKLGIEYDIKYLGAYNAMFDSNALQNTIRQLSGNEKAQFLTKDFKNVEMMCIWCLACETIFMQKRFQKEAIKNNWLTPAGNFRTSAEIGHRYLTGIEDFEEEHTGLEDVKIEIGIMAQGFKQNVKRKGGMFAHPWRIPNKK